MESNTKFLKSLTQGKGAQAAPKKALNINIPGLESVKKAMKNVKGKQVADLVLFTAGIFLMY